MEARGHRDVVERMILARLTTARLIGFGLGLALALMAAPAFPQGTPVYQLGAALPGHVVVFARNGQIVDSGLALPGTALSFIAPSTVLGNVLGVTALPIPLTRTQLTTLVNPATNVLLGAVRPDTTTITQSGGVLSTSGMTANASNATLPGARNNLGLGTADTPMLSGLNLVLTSETMPTAPILSIAYGAEGAPLATGPEYGGYGFASIIYANPGVGINDPITGAVRGDSFLAAGTKGLAVGGFLRGYTSGTWGPDGSINAGSVGVWAEGRTSRGGAVYGVYGLAQSDTTAIASSAQAAEFDTGISTSVDAKFGVAIVSTDTDSGAVTGTSTVAGSGATVSKSAGILIQGAGGASTGYKYGLLTITHSGGSPPVPTTGSLWRSGGYTVARGLDWYDMTFTGPVIHAKGLIQLDNTTAGAGSADGLLFKSLVGADAKTTSITLQEYSGLAVASIDFIGNSLSNFESRIALSTSSGSGKVERFSVAQDGGLYSKNATGGSKGADTLNLGAPLYANGNAVIGGGAGYNVFYDGSGVDGAITSGPTGDPTIYYDRTTHLWRGNGGTGTLARLASGLQIGTPTDGDKGAGTLNLSGAVYDNGTAPTGTAGSGYVRATAPAFNGMSLLSGTLTNVPGPTVDSDAVNMAYVNAIAAGIVTHAAVAAATTANLTATASGTGPGKTLTNSGAQAAFATDGYAGLINDRILVKNQTAAADNGIYTLTTVGTGATNWVLTRATDFDAASAFEVAAGASAIVINGSTLAATNWVETGQGPFTLETTPIVFSQVIGASASGTVSSGTTSQLGYYAGAGATISGLATANNGVLTTNGSGVPAISTTIPAATQANITQVGTIATGVWAGTVIANTAGGTGSNLSATGGADNFVQQNSVGAAFTVGTRAAANLSNGTTGSGAIVLAAGGALTGITGLGIRDTSAAFDVTIAAVSSTGLSAGRILTLDMKNVAHTLAFGATANTITFPNTSSYTLVGSQDVGTVTNTMLAGSISPTKLLTFAHTQRTVAADAGTTNVTGLMMGLAGTITPTSSGNVRISVCGDNKQTAVGSGVNTQLRTGTGAAPTVGAALTGTTRGSLAKFVASTVAGKTRTCLQWTITGLALSTAVWIDVGRAAVTSGTATFNDVDIIADEIP